MNTVDIIVVGLGPAGVTLAGLLGQQGLSVAVFDKLPDLYPLPRAIGLDHEAMRIVQELGVADLMAPHIAPYRPSEYLGMDGKLIKRLDTLPEPHLLGWLPNYVFDQPAFERVLRGKLAEMPNVQVYLEADVKACGQTPRAAWVDVQLRGQSELTRFSAAYVIACDGGSSPIRKCLGIGLEDLNFDEHWLVVDAIVSDAKLAALPQTQVQYCEAARPSTFVVGPGNHRRWEIMLLEGDSLSLDFPENELWPLLSRWIKPGEGKIWRAAAYRFHGLVATQWRIDRILLAGDAAHMTPPFMAQGMVSGMRDAHNLAWKLTRVITGASPQTLLDTYPQERKPHVEQTIKTAMGLGRIICERDASVALERDARLRAMHGGAIKTEYRQNMIPGLDHGVIDAAAEAAGVLFPQPFVIAENFSGRLDDFTGACVRVVVNGPMSTFEETSYLRLLDHLGGVLVQIADVACDPATRKVIEKTPLIAPWLQHRAVAIVRPDHYVFGTAENHSNGLEMLNLLKNKLG